MTLSPEPDGSILGLARQDLSSGSAVVFLWFLLLLLLGFLHYRFENTHNAWYVDSEQISFLML